ncbi:Uncharacterized protein YcsI, UPF0317 family [Xaviernesmea oryzae]|uniref:Uncharacterized protein YcsI, UPF0317 family n=1 Tax=Xaviernesmea oryzae TaxID=464029 RepID=A0A1X7FQ00_9HYPH|nr:DUF1445 domain-containing protein [Xaviernesmea oryzae]SMF55827.1 Uncharacterized protein YcsI, UPF0317 family [Xaviernesmea oryzae]
MFEAGHAETGQDVRMAARTGFSGTTVGRAPGYVQANVYILPETHAADFASFCKRNPEACPLLARSEPGRYLMPGLGRGIDIRRDLPAYHVHENGSERPAPDIIELWRPDLVAFAIGCWLGAEGALADMGIQMRHRTLRRQGGLYRTNRHARPSGPFQGPLVVSMRPFRSEDLARVVAITEGMPLSHGAPVHIGDAARLGIDDLAQAHWGDPVLPEAGETAVYWPCGLTALAAIQNAGLPFFISHAPGAMLVTDLKETFRPCPSFALPSNSTIAAHCSF